MGILKQHLGNTTSTTILDQLRDLWRSPRGAVIRIEALALIAIALSFLLAAFGSCRRWSNRWIIQKGFLAANVFSLSLGTYSIGLMQSSSVKSDMYPFWAVSLLTLFGCPSLVSVQPNQRQPFIRKLAGYMSLEYALSDPDDLTCCDYLVYLYHHNSETSSKKNKSKFAQKSLASLWRPNPEARKSSEWHKEDTIDQGEYPPAYKWSKYLGVMTIREIWSCNNSYVIDRRDVCLSLSLSHLLQRRYFGIPCAEARDENTRDFIFKGLLRKKDSLVPDYERAFKVIEVEMALLYDAFFTGNVTLHSQQAQASSVWQFTSVIGICFVGATALNHGTSSGHISGGTIVVDTTIADLIITQIILASLALLQVLQLIRCWTSNWARVKFVHDYIRKKEVGCVSPGMRVRALLTRINGFDSYLWQNKTGQYSFVESLTLRMRKCKLIRRALRHRLSLFFGFQHVYRVLGELFGRESGRSIKLHADVKEAVAEFLCKIRTESDSSSTLDPSGSSEPYTSPGYWNDFSHTEKVLAWHNATCYCELELGKTSICCFRVDQQDFLTEEGRKYHGVATALSKYYAYLVVSAPDLLYSDPNIAKDDAKRVAWEARRVLCGPRSPNIFQAMILSENKFAIFKEWCFSKLKAVTVLVSKISSFKVWNRQKRFDAMNKLVVLESIGEIGIFEAGVELGKQLVGIPERWKVLQDFWVQALLYAAPCGDAKEHIRHLSQGGEFITHLWALLSHAGIHDWERDAKTLWRHGDSFTRWPECTLPTPDCAPGSASGVDGIV
ncbi:hypothetical protein ACP4OV_012056 [Aristida adscensionis]